MDDDSRDSEEKPTKAFDSDLVDEDGWLDPSNLEKGRINEEVEVKQGQTASWHTFGTF